MGAHFFGTFAPGEARDELDAMRRLRHRNPASWKRRGGDAFERHLLAELRHGNMTHPADLRWARQARRARKRRGASYCRVCKGPHHKHGSKRRRGKRRSAWQR
jgi:hypothetical protein